MSDIPNTLKYTRTHEWIREEADGTFTVGITDHAQHLLGDIVFVELPEVGRKAEARGEISVVESVKAAADVYSPLDGEVSAVNEQLKAAPELINTSPYDAGWLFKLKSLNADTSSLLDAQAYEAQVSDS